MVVALTYVDAAARHSRIHYPLRVRPGLGSGFSDLPGLPPRFPLESGICFVCFDLLEFIETYPSEAGSSRPVIKCPAVAASPPGWLLAFNDTLHLALCIHIHPFAFVH